jgi:hypothetical protein
VKVTISVTQDDIDNGERQRCATCPVALAIRRVLPGAPMVSVGGWSVLLSTELEVLLPGVAEEFIAAFDRYAPVAPFEFELEVPREMTEVPR